MSIELFLSAVSDEFRSYRDSLRSLLARPNVVVHVQEDFIPTGTETVDKLDSAIKQCNTVIHLAGDMTGSWAEEFTLRTLRGRYRNLADQLPPLKQSLSSGTPPLSYTQWEAYLAVYHGKALVIAAPKTEAPRDQTYCLSVEDQASQQAHLERLRALGRHVEVRFKDVDELAAKVLKSTILDLLVEAGVVVPIKAVFSQILKIANTILEKADQLVRAKDRKRMAELFEHISASLSDVSTEIRAGRVPYGQCGALLHYSQNLSESVREAVGDAEADRLSRALVSAYNVEQVALDLRESDDAEKELCLKEIEEASGKFHAAAMLVRMA